MTWTKEEPKATGWYWFRGPIVAISPAVIYVDMTGESAYRREPVAWLPMMDYADPLADFSGEWSGPIGAPA